jgi:hypothetical protein
VHFANKRDFIAHGGIPGLAARSHMEVEARRVMAADNMGIYLLRPAA